MVNKPRIYQLLRRAGLINTRSDAINLLKSGKVIINGLPVKNPEFQVNPKKESILVNNKPLELEIPKVYYILNKPEGYITSRKRIHGKKHVLELINCDKTMHKTLFPVGRLDFNTTGLLVITNDGNLAHRILDPKNNIEKEYLVKVKGKIKDVDIKTLKEGIIIPVSDIPYKTLSAEVKIISSNNQSSELSIIIHEGKKRQVRLMLSSLGYNVLSLERIRIGNLKPEIEQGKYIEINKEKLYSLLNLPHN